MKGLTRREGIVGLLVAVTGTVCPPARAADFVKGDLALLTKETPLMYADKPFRTGKAREAFVVEKVDPFTSRVYLRLIGQDGQPLAVNVPEESLVPEFSPKFSPAEEALLTAASSRYELNGRVVDPPSDRASRMNAAAASPDTIPGRIAKQMLALDDLMSAAQAASQGRADALKDFGDKWRGYILTMPGNDPSNQQIAQDVGSMMSGIQQAQLAEYTTRCLDLDLTNALRNDFTTLAVQKNTPPPANRVPVAVSTVANGNLLWIRLENRAAYTFHQCVITARRCQDEKRADQINGDLQTANLLGGLLGLPDKTVAMNDTITRLGIRLRKTESGSFAYVPALPPGGVFAMPISSLENFDNTISADASTWCNEGAAPSVAAANLVATRDALLQRAKQQMEAARTRATQPLGQNRSGTRTSKKPQPGPLQLGSLETGHL